MNITKEQWAEALSNGHSDMVMKGIHEGMSPDARIQVGKFNASPLMIALKGNQSVVLDKLIKAGAKLDGESHVVTLLGRSVQMGDEASFRVLLPHWKPGMLDNRGISVLHYGACFCPKIVLYRKFLQAGENPDTAMQYRHFLTEDAPSEQFDSHTYFFIQKTQKGWPETVDWTALHLACFFNRLQIVRELLKYGAQPEVLTADQETPLKLLDAHPSAKANIRFSLVAYGADPAKEGYPAHRVKQLRKKAAQKVKVQLLSPDKTRKTSAKSKKPTKKELILNYQIAAVSGDTEELRKIIEVYGLPADQRLREPSRSASTCGIVLAAENGHMEAVRYLASKGSAAGVLHTAIRKAIEHNQPRVIEILYPFCEKIIDQDHDYWLGIAIQKQEIGKESLLKCLLSLNLRPLRQAGFTAIGQAADLGDADAVRELLRAGADPDSGISEKSPVLIRAITAKVATTKKSKVVKQLLEAGAGPNVRNHTDATPLHAAFFQDDDAERLIILKLLIDHGADKTLTNNQQQTPFQMAVNRKSSLEIQKLLRP